MFIVHTFVENFLELIASCNLSDHDMLTAIFEVLKGSASFWFKDDRELVKMWSEFVSAFKDSYFPLNLDKYLSDEICKCTQSEAENIADYITVVHTLIHQLCSSLYAAVVAN